MEPLHEAAKAFIDQHQYADPYALLLKPSPLPGYTMAFLVQQIEGRRRARTKLPGWHANPGVIYPPKLSLEQCSSEVTARFKASLLAGQSLLDLTGGMGVDTLAFASIFPEVVYVEEQASLCELAKHNFGVLGQGHIRCVQSTAEEFLVRETKEFAAIFIDPARREEGRKVFFLQDCQPDVTALLEVLLKRAPQVLLKASPLLDIRQACGALQGKVADVWAIQYGGECKEVLYRLTPDTVAKPRLHAVTLSDSLPPAFFHATWDEEQPPAPLALPEKYLYEPHAAVLKLGAFHAVAKQFSLKKLHANSHLYTSIEKVDAFPGRCFIIEQVCDSHKKGLAQALPQGQANLTIRNYPGSVEMLRKQTGLREGGDAYVFATTLANGKKALICCKKA